MLNYHLSQIPEGSELMSSLCINACRICLSACGSYDSISKTVDTSCNTVHEVCGDRNDLECRELNDFYNWNELYLPELSME